MLYLIHGEDNYQILEELEKLKKELAQEGENLNIVVYEANNFEPENFQNQVLQMGLFAPKQIFIIKNLITKGKKETQKKVASIIENIKDQHIIFVEESLISEENSIYQIIKRKGKIKEFKLLYGENLQKWVLNKIKEKKIKIYKDALDLLIILVGNNLFEMENEIEKLYLYCREKGKTIIEKEDVESLCGWYFDVDIFQLIDAVGKKNEGKALSILLKLLSQGEDPLAILGMLNYQFKNLLIIKSLIKRDLPEKEIVQKTGLHPFVVKKTINQASYFREEELKEIYKRLLDIDLQIKTGVIAPQLALQIFLTSLSNKNLI